MKDANNDSAKELIPRYLTGEVSDDEKKQLQDWIASSSENERFYTDARKVFSFGEKHYAETTKALNNLDINVDQEWDHFMATIATKNETPARELQSQKTSYAAWYKIAATLLLIAVSGFVVYYFSSKPEDLYYQTADNTSSVSLPDGSHVTLNRNSKLRYSSTDNERTVSLSGEAFFDVAHDATKPFVITVNNARVEVVGTSFNIRAYDVDKSVEVIVKTGTVKLSVPSLNKEIKLTAGNKGLYTTKTEKVDNSVNKDINFLAWNTQQIIFEENDLLTVVQTLNKVYGVTITLPADIPASCVVTVTFDHQTLESVLHVLETTLNLTYKISGNQIEITNAGC